jgi:hypothetical protein
MRSAYKRGIDPPGSGHAFVLPSCIAPFHLLSPRMGCTSVALLSLSLEDARPRGDRRPSAIARLQGFSSCSPTAFPHQWAVWWGEASWAAASAPPSASRIFVIFAVAEGVLSRGPPLRRQRLAPSLSDLGRRAFAACGASSRRASSSPARAALALLPVPPPTAGPCCAAGCWGVAQHVVHCEGGVHVLGRPRSRSCGEDGREDLPVRFGADAVRRCGVGGQVTVSAEVVTTGGGCLCRRDCQCRLYPRPPSLWL